MDDEIIFYYIKNGFSVTGKKISDIPALTLIIRRKNKPKIKGDGIVDTGFDGGLLPNLELLEYLRGEHPDYIEELEGTGGEIILCEVYLTECWIGNKKNLKLRNVPIYAPTNPEYITREVLIGRELLNQLKITLDGRSAKTIIPI